MAGKVQDILYVHSKRVVNESCQKIRQKTKKAFLGFPDITIYAGLERWRSESR